MLLRHMGILSNVVQPFFLILEGFDDSNYRNENVPEAAGPEHIVFEIEIIWRQNWSIRMMMLA